MGLARLSVASEPRLQGAEEDLFSSAFFQQRIDECLGPEGGAFRISRLAGLRIAFPPRDFLKDYEKWPAPEVVGSEELRRLRGKADLLFFRKLDPRQRPDRLPPGSWVKSYSISPYLLLNQNGGSVPELRKEYLSKLGRTRRKLEREVGPTQLTIMDDPSPFRRSAWFENWIAFQQGTRRNKGQSCLVDDPLILGSYRRWVTGGRHLPEWMKLFQFSAGERIVAVGLFYLWRNTFLYFGPANTPDPALQKYGIGIQFTQSLIDWSTDNGVEVFDFLQGGHAYKLRWEPCHIRPLHQCIVPVSALGRTALAILQAKEWVMRKSNPVPLPTLQA